MISNATHTSILMGENEYFEPRKLYQELSNRFWDKNTQRMIRDLAFLALFTGNDYISKVQSLEIIPLWEYYLEYAKIADNNAYLVNEMMDGFNIAYLFKMLSHFDRFAEMNVMTLDINEKEGMEFYLQTLLWNLVLYKNGKCPDYYHRELYTLPTIMKVCAVLNDRMKNGEVELKYDFKNSDKRVPLIPVVYSALMVSVDHISTLRPELNFKKGKSIPHHLM